MTDNRTIEIMRIFEQAERIAGMVERNELDFEIVISAMRNIEPATGLQTRAILEPTITEYNFMVNYDLKLAEMIKAGKYNPVDDNIIEENFPVLGSGKKKIKGSLFHFNGLISTDNIIKKIDQRGIRPANSAEIIAFGTEFPDLQKEFPIVALGQSWTDPYDNRNVVCLDWRSFWRCLCFGLLDDDWNAHCRFLAVGKESA